MPDADRIAALRGRCLDRKASLKDFADSDQRILADADALRSTEHTGGWQSRVGVRTGLRLGRMEFEIDDRELLAGSPVFTWQGGADVEDAREYLKDYPMPGGQTGHCALDLSQIFCFGIDDTACFLERSLKELTDEEYETIASFLKALEGLAVMIARATTCLEEARKGASLWRRRELDELAGICRHIGHKPPETFHQALQLLWFVNMGVEYGDHARLICPGRLDRILRKYYDADIAAGRLTRERALLLIESLYLLINDFVPDGLAYNMKFPGDLFRAPGSHGRLRELIETFMARGGFETQVNVVNRETLLAAEKNPEQYRDLVVRIGGYTDYFTRLSPGMRREILMRTEHGI